MAIVSVNEHWENRKKTMALDKTSTYTRTWVVLTDNPLDGQFLVLAAAGIPTIGTPYETSTEDDSTAYVISREAVQDAIDPRRWVVTIEYTNRSGNPLAADLELSWSSAAVNVPVVFDSNSEAVVNSAGEPFDPPPEKEMYYPVLTIVKNQATFDPAVIVLYQGKVNSETFYDFPPYTVRCKRISATRAKENGITFWKATYEFEFREEGSELRMLDIGYRERDANGHERQILDLGGHPITKPALLDGGGGKLHDPEPWDAVELVFEIYNPADFTALEVGGV